MSSSPAVSFIGLLAVVVVVALVATVVVVVDAYGPPCRSTSGSAELPGLTGSVTVMRDGSGIPHIFGDSLTDLARAQGYVHAQEQFFQMDLRRHITAGRLSELVGKDGVETDKVDADAGLATGRRGGAAHPQAADPADAAGLRRRREHLPARPQPRARWPSSTRSSA